ncbi:hypothetical protein [Parasitella parasitica]|uniref:Uncharacterized protein n=1 Tax=Parasitella parasitica TaxID=35722 RepID=A0A0B7N8I4_9FUNG|nr:hypothetical protein [Parasitella parasitica]
MAPIHRQLGGRITMNAETRLLDGRREAAIQQGHCGPNTGIVQPVQSDGSVPAHTRSQECRSRQTVQEDHSVGRATSPSMDLQGHLTVLGADKAGHNGNTREQEGQEVLQLPTRSRSISRRCDITTVTEGGRLLLPAMEADSTGLAANQNTTTEEGIASNAVVADSVLASSDIADETISTSNPLSQQVSKFGRLDVIRKAREN